MEIFSNVVWKSFAKENKKREHVSEMKKESWTAVYFKFAVLWIPVSYKWEDDITELEFHRINYQFDLNEINNKLKEIFLNKYVHQIKRKYGQLWGTISNSNNERLETRYINRKLSD